MGAEGLVSRKIGLVSDPHATPEPLAEAMAIFQREGVDLILCAGDIGGYGDRLDETVILLKEHRVHSVYGNHESWALKQHAFRGSKTSRDYLASLPDHLEFNIEGVRIYMVHAEPPNKQRKGLRLFDQNGAVIPEVMAEWNDRLTGSKFDVLILGHTHQVFDIRLGKVLVINPGSCTFNHSCAVLNLASLEVTWFALEGKSIEKVWNWGQFEVR